MREIKFRIWDNYQKVFLSHREQLEVLEMVGFNDKEGRMIWQQFTGLYDKNGKEIYEGDVIEFGWQQKTRSVVTFEKGCFMHKTNVLFIGHEQCEIIGNIFENPELIKK